MLFNKISITFQLFDHAKWPLTCWSASLGVSCLPHTGQATVDSTRFLRLDLGEDAANKFGELNGIWRLCCYVLRTSDMPPATFFAVQYRHWKIQSSWNDMRTVAREHLNLHSLRRTVSLPSNTWTLRAGGSTLETIMINNVCRSWISHGLPVIQIFSPRLHLRNLRFAKTFLFGCTTSYCTSTSSCGMLSIMPYPVSPHHLTPIRWHPGQCW